MSERENKKQKPELDTETTFADMNVEGFSWYDPGRKAGKQRVKVDRKEYWAMVKAAFEVYLPIFGILIAVGGIIFAIAYLWLK